MQLFATSITTILQCCVTHKTGGQLYKDLNCGWVYFTTCDCSL